MNRVYRPACVLNQSQKSLDQLFIPLRSENKVLIMQKLVIKFENQIITFFRLCSRTGYIYSFRLTLFSD
jgi:hypothetical protein